MIHVFSLISLNLPTFQDLSKKMRPNVKTINVAAGATYNMSKFHGMIIAIGLLSENHPMDMVYVSATSGVHLMTSNTVLKYGYNDAGVGVSFYKPSRADAVIKNNRSTTMTIHYDKL